MICCSVLVPVHLEEREGLLSEYAEVFVLNIPVGAVTGGNVPIFRVD